MQNVVNKRLKWFNIKAKSEQSEQKKGKKTGSLSSLGRETGEFSVFWNKEQTPLMKYSSKLKAALKMIQNGQRLSKQEFRKEKKKQKHKKNLNPNQNPRGGQWH